MDYYNEFLKRTDERKKSAHVKLKLLVNGVKDAPEIFKELEGQYEEEHYAYDNGNWGVDKNRFTPTGLLLPGGIVSKLHIRPESPLSLLKEGDKLYVKNDVDNEILSEFLFLKRPKFWDYKTSKGIPTKNLAQIYGLNCLNFNIFSGCQFYNAGFGCKFCSVKNTVRKDNPVKIVKDPDELAEVAKIATENDDFDYMIITGGSHLDGDEEFDAYVKILEKIRYNLPWGGKIKGNVAFMPPKDLSKLKKLKELEVENPSFNMEVWPKENFQKICPGKDKYVGFDHIVDALLYLREIYGPGKVWSNFVAGIVPLEDMKAGFKVMAEHGIVPGANIYHAEVDSFLGNRLGKISEEYVLELYKYAAKLYHEYGFHPFFDAGVLRNSLANEAYEGYFDED